MLTTLKIKSAQPVERAFKLADAGGLFLAVQPSGAKLWRYKFRVEGVEGLLSLGAFPEVSLADAGSVHTDARKLVAKGIHPVQARRAAKAAVESEKLRRTKGSFDAVTADWKQSTAVGLRPSTILQRNREIKKAWPNASPRERSKA